MADPGTLTLPGCSGMGGDGELLKSKAEVIVVERSVSRIEIAVANQK
ncbi:MAG: hypothetical protein ACOCXC_01485 [Fibrobacterota bacterium]